VHFVDKIRIYGVQGRGLNGNGKSHWNVILMAYKGNGNKTVEKVYKRLYTKLPLNRAVHAGQFTS